MGKLLYMTDMEYSPFSFKSKELIILLSKRITVMTWWTTQMQTIATAFRGHCSLDTCKGIVEANKTPDLWTVTLIHLSDSAADPDRMKREIQEVAGKWVSVNIAEKGKAWELSRFPWGG